MTDSEKDLEILLLRRRLRVAERQQARGPQIPWWQKVSLTALADSVRLFKSATLISRHQAIVRRKWIFQRSAQPGRPPMDAELEDWIVRITQENPGLGYDKLIGELRKVGFKVSATALRSVLRRHGIPPAPGRSRSSSSWRPFLHHYRDQFLACDFITVETMGLATLYVLFFLEHVTRRVYVAGCTAQPTAAWVVRQARHKTWALEEREPSTCYLIHNHDTKFTERFDRVFESTSIEIVSIPFAAPNTNAFAER